MVPPITINYIHFSLWPDRRLKALELWQIAIFEVHLSVIKRLHFYFVGFYLQLFSCVWAHDSFSDLQKTIRKKPFCSLFSSLIGVLASLIHPQISRISCSTLFTRRKHLSLVVKLRILLQFIAPSSCRIEWSLKEIEISHFRTSLIY